MNIHAILHGSRANGPELRSVVWVRGCNLGCGGCVNRATWDFTGGTQYDPDDLAREIFAHCLPGTKGITVSGGEPMHQAVSLLAFFKAVRARRPDFSLGMFTGYTWHELIAGTYDLLEPLPERYRQSTLMRDRDLVWHALYPMLDFVKMGRWDATQPGNDAPLCTSANQELILPTIRYKREDFGPNVMEFNIEADGIVTITGFPL